MIGLPEILVIVAIAILLFLPISVAAIVIWVIRRNREEIKLCRYCGMRISEIGFCSQCGKLVGS